MAEETKAPEKAPEKTKSYLLKKGAQHTIIVNGERQRLTGDGKIKVDLTENQFAAFKDKVVVDGDATENTKTQDAVDATTSGVPVHGASSGASAASAGTPQPASEADAEILKSGTSDGKAGQPETKTDKK